MFITYVIDLSAQNMFIIYVIDLSAKNKMWRRWLFIFLQV